MRRFIPSEASPQTDEHVDRKGGVLTAPRQPSPPSPQPSPPEGERVPKAGEGGAPTAGLKPALPDHQNLSQKVKFGTSSLLVTLLVLHFYLTRYTARQQLLQVQQRLEAQARILSTELRTVTPNKLER